MTKVIKPILSESPLNSSVARFFTMFKPIQATKDKQSDVVAYLATPVLDYFVLDTIFALDIGIRAMNAVASLLKAAYVWTMNQQISDSIIDGETQDELDDFMDNLTFICESMIAQLVNLLLSTVSLVTRPIASIVTYISPEDEESSLSPVPAF